MMSTRMQSALVLDFVHPRSSRGTDLRGGGEKEDVWNQVLWSFSQNCGLSSLELLETPCELSAETFLSA